MGAPSYEIASRFVVPSEGRGKFTLCRFQSSGVAIYG
jgi:hypothetical protein